MKTVTREFRALVWIEDQYVEMRFGEPVTTTDKHNDVRLICTTSISDAVSAFEAMLRNFSKYSLAPGAVLKR